MKSQYNFGYSQILMFVLIILNSLSISNCQDRNPVSLPPSKTSVSESKTVIPEPKAPVIENNQTAIKEIIFDPSLFISTTGPQESPLKQSSGNAEYKAAIGYCLGSTSPFTENTADLTSNEILRTHLQVKNEVMDPELSVVYCMSVTSTHTGKEYKASVAYDEITPFTVLATTIAMFSNTLLNPTYAKNLLTQIQTRLSSQEALELAQSTPATLKSNPLIINIAESAGMQPLSPFDGPNNENRIVYGSSQDMLEESRLDCEKRGGKFDGCGSTCAEGSACPQVCVIICYLK